MLKNIIFPGGGFKGWAYIGTIRALNEIIDFKNIEQVIGTSIGSLFALCYILRIEWSYLLDFVMNLDFKEMIDIDIDNILTNQSLLHGKKYYEIIKEIISTKVKYDITFIELHGINPILFTVNAFNITKSKDDYFNYVTTPNLKIIDAIMASSSIPLVFPAYKINNNYYYDGGLTNNCPFNVVDQLETMIFEISIYDSNKENCSTNTNLYEFVYSIMNYIENNKNINRDDYIIINIIQEKYNNDMVNINQTKDDIFNIYMYGYLTSKKNLFENFIALPCY
jgi:predicted acylesterase/phospholipase RssA